MKVAPGYENDHIRPLSNDTSLNWLRQVMRRHDVMDQEFQSRQLNDAGLGIIKSGIVRVATYSCYGRDLLQIHQDPRQTDVTGVQYVRGTLKERWYPRIEEIVRV